ncbi:glycosyltransferase [Sediminicoccus sp. BL-A-41-H5]|uniref:glycosyltransferase n=1 Tax=Sediminicoccus sp. BL-A-41-H5 TaxID=3421106 RepID=UPI003D6754A2
MSRRPGPAGWSGPAGAPLRVVTLSTLFPHAVQPHFGVFVGAQTRALAARPGVEVRVVSPLPLPPPPLDRLPRYARPRALPLEEEWHGLRVARPRLRLIPGLSAPFNPWLLARAVRPVLAAWRAEGFTADVLDAEFFFPDGPAAIRLARELGLPCSIKARGADIHFWGRRRGTAGQVRRAGQAADGLLAVSAALARDMVAMGMPAQRVSVHYTGCDLDHFRPRPRVAAKRALGVAGPLVVSLGALIPRKGHALVVAAMRELPDATLLIAGGGPEAGRLAALVRRLGLEGRVRLLGPVPHGELPALLAAADVMALASASEGLANAWIEAMACGTPVVTPDVDGAREALDRPAAGRLLAERTPEAIAAAIRAILADPPPPAAVRAVAERFTWPRNAAELHAHLARLAGREWVMPVPVLAGSWSMTR